MTILEFLKTEAIIESDNDVYIDASEYDEEDINEWLEDCLYPLLDEDQLRFIKEFPIDGYESLEEYLTPDEDEEDDLPVLIVKSALAYRHIPAIEEEYYINNSGDFHVEVSL